MDNTFLQGRITATKALIIIYEDAVTALVGGQVQQYTLDTGQDRQTVLKADIPKLNAQIDGLYNRLCTLQARLDGSGVLLVRPKW